MVLSDAIEVLAESYRTFPSATQAQAAALVWSQMVANAGRHFIRMLLVIAGVLLVAK